MDVFDDGRSESGMRTKDQKTGIIQESCPNVMAVMPQCICRCSFRQQKTVTPLCGVTKEFVNWFIF